ncbi:MAG: saccharopine dehydrogenase NADP-binding domain-containing protein [Solirubrobacterales bacterium]|nr:saccharopine dehydrogenase NADP-binding domain-containing protein [Solirubrobacterales bacterium]
MDTATAQGPITVYGATGYTGRLIAAELTRREAQFVIAGRSQEKLDALADRLVADGGHPEIAAIPTSDSRSLRDLFSRSGAVIACAGPFTLHGEPVLTAAIETGTPYVDTTGEQGFIRGAFENWGVRASAAGIPVIPAMGFDYVPGDLLAALTAEALGPEADIDRVRLAYHAPFQPTRGTMRSALEMIKGGDLEWRDGTLRPASQSISRPDFDFGGELGTQAMMHYPAGEHITVPRHLSPRTVETSLTIASFAPGRAGRAMPVAGRALGLAMRTPMRKLVSKAISALPEGADEQGRTETRFTIGCEVTSRRETAEGRLTGTDVYGLTAAMIVEAAIRATRGEIRGEGVLAPAQAFDPADFLGEFARFEIDWTVGPAR